MSRATRLRRLLAGLIATVLVAPALASVVPNPTALADQTPGMGFTVSPADLDFILDQIIISEKHTAAKACFDNATLAAPCNKAALEAIDLTLGGLVYDQANDPNLCAALRLLVGNPLLSFGLRLTDGSCNNLQPGQEKYGAADQPFPRLTQPVFSPAEPVPAGFGPTSGQSTSYAQTNGLVFDSEPRTVSNIIVDQTSTNPAAICASQFPTRAQGVGAACDLNAVVPADVPEHKSLPIENITTDVGLSPPFNSLFTIFGQFFDHGLDKITNGGNGTVFVPLKADDPLRVAGPDGIPGNGDEVPANQAFMVLTRGKIVPGPDGNRSAPNTDTPFIDQSQTYTSHASHQVFTREYVLNDLFRPVSTGKFLGTADGGLPTWAQVKEQSAEVLGLLLNDGNVGNIPLIATDGYGKFIPGPVRGLPQFVTGSGLIEGNTAAPVAVPADAFFIGTAFLNDIAHSAAPTVHKECPTVPTGPPSPCVPAGDPLVGQLNPDLDLTAGGSLDTPLPLGSYDNELLDLHFICGDGRCNENIALSAIHQVFHSEHDRLVDDIESTILANSGPGGLLKLAEWQTPNGAPSAADGPWNGERLFQAARFVTEMEYQHLVFEEFARKVQPLINPFEAFAFNQTDIDPAITAEFAHAVYRFGHSMLDDSIPRINEDANGNKTPNDIGLLEGFLNPAAYYDGGTAGTLNAREAAGSIIMGLSDQTGQEIDEFVVETLRNNLLGLPLDLPAINMARARSEGVPSLNEVRRQIFAATNDSQMTPYTDWVDFGQNLKHPESLVNFIAAYGKHPSIMTLDPDGVGPIVAGSIAARRAAADQLVNGTILPGPDGILVDNPATFIDESLDDTAGVPAEAFTDTNTNGIWDAEIPVVPAEPFTDTNTNGIWDAEVPAVPAEAFVDDVVVNGTWDLGESFTDSNTNGIWDAEIPVVPAEVFTDTNTNGIWDAEVPAVPAEPFIDANANGTWDAAVPTNCGADTICGDNPATFINEAADNVNPPADAADFMFAMPLTTWATTETGVNKIDLWVGGLAERTNLFGGLLGSTFNYVFEKQLTDLQNGDRFYYLARTPGMNLRAQLEGNSFAELMMRNTTAHSLKADPFANSDCKFELRNLVSPAPAGSQYFNGVGSIGDDLTSLCNENGVLIRMGDGTIRYRVNNPVNVPGINFQAVYNGRAGASDDRIYGGADNDTFWGGDGNDTIEGGDGADIALGGNGNDVITDLAGDDIPKGGPGDDAIDAGPGLDIIMGGDGNDFTNGGANINETFGGEGNDFAIAGSGTDVVFGDSGDDWMQGGDQPDLLIGDSSTLFFDDHNLPGNDIIIGQGGDDDYDGEGGDDVYVTGPGVEKNAGASGFDWSTGVGDPQPQNADLNLRIGVAAPVIFEVRDKFNELEALSGWKFDDTLRGDDIVPSAVGGGGFIGCDALDTDGVARIAGLVQILPPTKLTVDSAAIVAASATRFCQLEGLAWGAGNILLGGAGNDTLEGRGADDLIDGDRWLNVRLSIRSASDPLVEIGTTDLMDRAALSGNFGPGTAGMTLMQAVFARKVNIAQIVSVRELIHSNPANVTPADCDAALPVNCDTALFSGDFIEYTITSNGDGSVTVQHDGGFGVDGTDTLWNVEQVSFCVIPGLTPGTCDLREVFPVSGPVPAPIAVLTVPLGAESFAANSGVATAPELITLTNIGNADLVVTGTATLTGDDAFHITPGGDLCVGQTLAPNDACTVSVFFRTTVAGPLQAILEIPNDAVLGDSQAFLFGHITAPLASITPLTMVGFQAQAPLGESLVQTAIITNNGDGDLTFTAPASIGGADGGDFSIAATSCLGTLIAGDSCDVDVVMTPGSGGLKAATLDFHHNDLAGDSQVALSGFATQGAALLSPDSLTFNGEVGVAGADQSVLLFNVGSADLTVNTVLLGGADPTEFDITGNDCLTVVPAGFCTISVQFIPTTAGVKSAQVEVTHDGTGGVSTLPLTGTATAPIITVNPTSLAFPSSMVTVQTATQIVNVGNDGDANLTVGAVTLGGTNPADFRIVSNGCTTVAPLGTCPIGVAFRPNAIGARSATLNIANNSGVAGVVTLTGTGLTPVPVMVVQGTLNFPDTRVGRTRTLNLRVTNNGPGNLNIGTLVLSAGARFTANRGNCPGVLGVGRSCSLTVTFRPNALRLFTATLTINSNAQGNPHLVNLRGRGV